MFELNFVEFVSISINLSHILLHILVFCFHRISSLIVYRMCLLKVRNYNSLIEFIHVKDLSVWPLSQTNSVKVIYVKLKLINTKLMLVKARIKHFDKYVKIRLYVCFLKKFDRYKLQIQLFAAWRGGVPTIMAKYLFSKLIGIFNVCKMTVRYKSKSVFFPRSIRSKRNNV